MHIRQQKDTKNMHRNFHCNVCDYTCSRKFLWEQHLLTRKHKSATSATKNMHSGSDYTCSICGRTYKHRSGLWRHKKKCEVSHTLPKEQSTGKKYVDLCSTLARTLERDAALREDLLSQMDQQRKIIDELIPRIGDTTNNKLSINVFLNEWCRDAINLSDFLKSLNIESEQLNFTNEHGLIEGIRTLFIERLKELDTHRRPIHCTDAKRETLYIKDNDSWEKNRSVEYLKKAIDAVVYKHREAISAWQANNQGWEETEEGRAHYVDLVSSVMGDVNTKGREKIIKDIIKESLLTNDMRIG